jgi:hypothetical protein
MHAEQMTSPLTAPDDRDQTHWESEFVTEPRQNDTRCGFQHHSPAAAAARRSVIPVEHRGKRPLVRWEHFQTEAPNASQVSA